MSEENKCRVQINGSEYIVFCNPKANSKEFWESISEQAKSQGCEFLVFMNDNNEVYCSVSLSKEVYWSN